MYDEKIAIEEQGIDIKKWLVLFLRNWMFLLVCVVIAMACAMVYIVYTPPVYELSTNILVNNKANPLDKAQLFTSAFYNDPYQLENEKGVLNAKSVTRKALQQLDFDVAYYLKNRFNRTELYSATPFSVDIDTSHLQPLDVFFSVRFLSDTLIVINAEGEDVLLYDFITEKSHTSIKEFHFNDTLTFGQITGNSFCRFTLMPGFEYLSEENLRKTYYFRFCSIRQLTGTFRQFKIENDRGSSILHVSFRYTNPGKAAVFLNKLTAQYLQKGVERDNLIARATIRFIDHQLTEIVDSLYTSGERLQDFRTTKKVHDIGFQTEKAYSRLEILETEKAKLMVKKRYFNYLIENLQLKSEVNELVPPTTLDINDPVLNNLIMELVSLYSERAELSFNSIKDNPYISSLERKIADTRRKLLDASRNVLEATDISLEETDSQISEAEHELDHLPKAQQQLINIERRFKLNDELYTYLLTRRSEMEIFRASNIPVNEILDTADPEDARIVSPDIRVNLMIALMLGLLFPGAVIYLRETLNNKIRSREDIMKLTGHTLIGQVIDSKNTNFPAALMDPGSVLTESYRTLRTNLQFVINESAPNIILVTSAIQGEGKSFTALNLASVYAFYDKKTIMIDFDLRKSRISENLDIQTKKGLSNYLSKNATLDEIIIRDEKLNFDIILSGPVPPNPSELVSSALTSTLFTELRKRYDFIIINSPPMAIVSDALVIYPHVNTTLLVVRYNYTPTEVFETLLTDLKARDIRKINIVLNDISLSNSRYGYGYGYGYAYGYRSGLTGRRRN